MDTLPSPRKNIQKGVGKRINLQIIRCLDSFWIRTVNELSCACVCNLSVRFIMSGSFYFIFKMKRNLKVWFRENFKSISEFL